MKCLQKNNRSELERIDKERHDDFMSMLRGFVINQVSLRSSSPLMKEFV